MKGKISIFGTAVAIAAATVLSAPTFADYPDRAITWVIPSSAGGGSDRTGRTFMPFMAKHLGNAEIAVVNKPGAGGAVGIKAALTAPADGYTLAQPQIPQLISKQFENPNIGFNTDSVEFIGRIVSDYFIVAVRNDSPIKSLKAFLAEAKKQNGKLVCGTTGVGGSSHLGTLRFMKATGIKLKLVPFGGGSKVRKALLGGHIPAGCALTGMAAKVMDKVRILAVAAPTEFPPVAGVPTFKSLGYDLVAGNWRSLAVRKGTPKNAVDTLRAAYEKAISDPDFVKAAKKARVFPDPMSGPELRKAAKGLESFYAALWKESPWVAQKKK